MCDLLYFPLRLLHVSLLCSVGRTASFPAASGFPLRSCTNNHCAKIAKQPFVIPVMLMISCADVLIPRRILDIADTRAPSRHDRLDHSLTKFCRPLVKRPLKVMVARTPDDLVDQQISQDGGLVRVLACKSDVPAARPTSVDLAAIDQLVHNGNVEGQCYQHVSDAVGADERASG